MERNEFVKKCQLCAEIYETIGGVKINVPDELKMRYNFGVYYPEAYKLGFNKKGEAVHTAILHDLNANSIVNANLEEVKKYV